MRSPFSPLAPFSPSSIKHYTAGLILLLTMLACSEDDPISRRHPCRFFFYYEPHPTSLIFSAYRSAGMYVYVYTKTESNGRRHVYVQSNDGKTPLEDNIIATDIELQAPYMLGANNEIGLILGCTNFNGPRAYDRICPNCETTQSLHWKESNRQQVECPKCKRVYELETSNIVSGADGEPLMRYNINFDGNRLTVGN